MTVTTAASLWVERDPHPHDDLPFQITRADQVGRDKPVPAEPTEAALDSLRRAAQEVDELTCGGEVCGGQPIGYYLDGYEDPERDAYRPFYVYADGTMRCEDCGNEDLGI